MAERVKRNKTFFQKFDEYIWEKFAYQGEGKSEIPMYLARIKFVLFIFKSFAVAGLAVFVLIKFVPFLPKMANFFPL